MKIAVLFHNDADGFGSAWAAYSALILNNEMIFKPVQYGEPIPYKELREFGPDQVYILDFSYKAPDLRELMNEFNVVVIDPHKTAAEELKDFPEIEKVESTYVAYLDRQAEQVQKLVPGSEIKTHPETLPLLSGVRFHMENSGCVLSWLFFHPDEEIPELLCYVQDRDLWKFDLENSKEINAYIATMPFEFEAWDEFYLPLAYDAGKAILAFQARQIEGRVKAAERMTFITLQEEVMTKYELAHPFQFVAEGSAHPHGVFIPCVNASENISEVGDALCIAYPDAPFSMTYCDRPDGLRSYSLRSRCGFDVSEVAKAWNGGGHHGAAGFSLPSPPKI